LVFKPHFAGYRHPSPTTVARTVRILHTLLALVNKHRNCDKFEVNTQSVAYLAGEIKHSFDLVLTEKEWDIVGISSGVRLITLLSV